MRVFNRALLVAALGLGFAMVLGACVVAVLVVPDLKEIPNRVALGLTAIATCIAGIIVIARVAATLEASAKATIELHIPGLDAEVKRNRTA